MSDGPFPIVITLAGEPRGKGRPIFAHRRAKDGREFMTARTPERTRSYESALQFAASEVMRGRAPVDGPLLVTMTAVFSIPASTSQKKRAAMVAREVFPTKKPDADNLLKCTDALNKIVWLDDKQITVATVLKQYGEKPELRIVVRPARAVSA